MPPPIGDDMQVVEVVLKEELFGDLHFNRTIERGGENRQHGRHVVGTWSGTRRWRCRSRCASILSASITRLRLEDSSKTYEELPLTGGARNVARSCGSLRRRVRSHTT